MQNNISTEASYYGLKLNSGGTVIGNLLAQNNVSVYMEKATTLQNNVITEGVNFGATTFAWGIETKIAPAQRSNTISSWTTAQPARRAVSAFTLPAMRRRSLV